MNISDILSPHSIASHALSDSKKSALELISKLAASHINTLESREVLNTLMTREKLGSTAVGYGVALPHARIEGLEKPVGVLIQLKHPIDFDAPDDLPVDLLFGLLIPKESTDDHLNTLALLAEHFSRDQFRNKLRQASNNHELYDFATSSH